MLPQKHIKLTPYSRRFCEHCRIIKTFRYVSLFGHSICLTRNHFEARKPTTKDKLRATKNISIPIRDRKIKKFNR